MKLADGSFGKKNFNIYYEIDLKSALDFFEEKQHSMRNAAIADVKQRIEAEQQ